MNKLLIGWGTLVLAGLIGWWMIGPDWRRLATNMPTHPSMLFWSLEQRDAGFRMLDRMPFFVDTRTIKSGKTVRLLEEGEPLNLDFDIDAYIKEQRHVSMIILHDGKIRHESYNLGFTDHGRWTSHSVAKSITSTLVGAAVKDGYIESLNDPVSKYISGLKGSSYDDVTVEQLLTMSSGVAWTEDYDDPESDIARFARHEAEDGLPTLVSYMSQLPREHAPGEVWHYSTGETNLIGILVSEATGKTLSEYLSEKIWTPYGMQQDATWLLSADGEEISGCCIQAATRDFARFGQFILENAEIDGESIVPDDWLASATSQRVPTGYAGVGYGYQWWTYGEDAFAAIGIFGQGIYIDRARQLVIASNSSWTSALGDQDGENMRRYQFYQDIVQAIDKENGETAQPTSEE